MPGWNQDMWEKYQQPQICRWYHSKGRKPRGTQEPLDEGEGGEWKSWLKTKYSKKLRLWHLIPLLHSKKRGKGRSSDGYPLLGLQNHCGWWLQPWNQKATASWHESDDKSRQCVEKQRHFSADKGPYSQGYGLTRGHIWLWELNHKEGRTPENWCLRTVVLEKTPESPLTERRSNQSTLREINPEYSLEGLMLKLQYFGYLMWTNDSLENSLMLGKGRRRRGCQNMRRLDGIVDAMNMNLGKLLEMVRDREAWRATVHGVTKSQTWMVTEK